MSLSPSPVSMDMTAALKSSRARSEMPASKSSTPVYVKLQNRSSTLRCREDADVIGLSVLGAHMTLCPRIMELMKKEGLDDVLVDRRDYSGPGHLKLKDCGVAEVFQPGASTEEIIAYVRNNVRKK